MIPVMLSLLAAVECGPLMDVRTVGANRFDVEVRGAPVSSVLECVSEALGFRLVADSNTLVRQSLTIRLSHKTPTQIIDAVLDGAPVNYAYTTDRGGSRILVLMLSAKSAGIPSREPGSTEPGAGASELLTRGATGAPEATDRGLPPAPRDAVPTSDRPPEAARPPALYPEPRPLSPLSLRDANRVPGRINDRR